MSYQFPEIRNFDGLYLQANSFEVPDGAMEVANNVVIRSDKIISKTKGYFEYWRPDGTEDVETLSAFYTFQGKLIGIFENGAGYFTDSFPYGGTYNSEGVLTELIGEAFTATSACYFLEANQNLYFTANEGIYKLESFDAPVRKSGVVPGISLTIDDAYNDTGVLEADSQTAYRVVFGRRDTNGNLNLGAPSDTAFIGVPPSETTVAYTIVGGVVTVSSDIMDVLTGTPSRVGQDVIISAATNPALNGDQVITAVTVDTSFEFSTGEPNSAGTLTITVQSTPTITADIPDEITSTDDEWFVQVYRTTSSLSVTGAPDPDFKLVTEQTLTDEDLILGFVRYTDIVDNALLNGSELYTNPNTREGEAQGNLRPPQANVIGSYKGYSFFADVVTIQRLFLDMTSYYPSLLLYDIIFKVGATEEIYTSSAGASQAPNAVTGAGAGTITVTYPTFDPGAGATFIIYDITGTLAPGEYTVVTSAPGSFTFTAPNITDTMTAGTVEFLTQSGNPIFDVFTYSSITDAEALAITAKNLVKAVNRNSAIMYAKYLSGFEDFPGKLLFQSKGVSDPIYVRLSGTPTIPPFIQPVPTSFSVGKQIYSENDILPHGIYFSKIQEPEAVPVGNYFLVGSASARILASIALRDCIIIVKEDGVYKITGDVLQDFAVTELDSTVRGLGSCTRAAAEINNTVIAFSNQGILSITETTVSVISRRIEDVIQPLVGRDLSGTFLAGIEADRLFYVQTQNINVGQDNVTWVYNIINSTWTQTDQVFSHLAIGPNEELFGAKLDTGISDNVLFRQRKTQTLVDYCGGFTVGTATSVMPLSAVFTATGGNTLNAEVGDVILYGDVFNRITAVTGVGPWTVTFAQTTNIPNTSPTVTLLKAYTSNIKMAPFHAGQVGRSKHYAQLQIHLRQQAITDLILSFGGAYFGSSEQTDWMSSNISTSGSAGWGFSPWGLFPWGLTDGINLMSGTAPANIIRTYVPRFAARNTFLQTLLSHTQAGQPMLIQALSFCIRGFGERNSK